MSPEQKIELLLAERPQWVVSLSHSRLDNETLKKYNNKDTYPELSVSRYITVYKPRHIN